MSGLGVCITLSCFLTYFIDLLCSVLLLTADYDALPICALVDRVFVYTGWVRGLGPSSAPLRYWVPILD
jgi:hypothetical protein